MVPFVSVVIPCRNEAAHIRKCIDSLLHQQHPRERMEITFVDGMSTDGTREILEHAAARYDNVRFLDNPKFIVPTAMNIGIMLSRGDVIIRMDAHSEYPSDYIPRLLKLLDDTKAGNAGGRVVNIPNGDTDWAKAVAYVTGHRFGVGNGAWRTSEQPGFVDTVPNGAFPRHVLARVGVYDERLTRNQDNELNARLAQYGFKVAFDPTIRIRYYNQGTLTGLWHQGFFTGMWNVYTLYLHPYTFKWRRFVPAAFVVYLLLAAATVRVHAWMAAPLLLYLGLLGLCSAPSGREGGGFLRAAATFSTYHVLYGLGTHFGLLNLALGRWRRYLGRPLRP